MKRFIPTLLALLIVTLSACTDDGMVDVKSSFGVEETGDRLEEVLKDKGMTIFDRVMHSEAAKDVGVELRETELIIFGNPKAGSPLMKCQQSVALDLPQKALVWEDSEGITWISYNHPRYLEKRHSISNCDDVLSNIEEALAAIVNEAASD
ncbi:DUF302 domain-containing protein [Rhodohalobacter barkolensis]|uniref:DUF302 domain-containing protein n=1 Tax=Rhodohalobacter barkolensis TaxID=2053187 RepID=A0A2N0VEZ0_9BACT|nr:DUF302 domain-containing protein [Rhodohalobacter barkolensis]PKD42759.1 hypothetical protein CWD77_14700 [Rhodohalobacter barkolensis]